MTAAQHNSFVDANVIAGASETITLSTVGTLTGFTAVEKYNITATSAMTLGALTQNVEEIGTEGNSTLVFGAGAYTGTFTNFEATDVLKVVDGTDISGVTGLDVGVLDFQDGTATITLDAAQNGSLSILSTGADSGTQTIIVDEVDTFTGDANIEKYNITATSAMTLGALTQNVEEIGTEGNSTLVFGAGAYTGTFTNFEATDVLKVVDGTDISGVTGLDVGVLDFQDGTATITLDAAQNGSLSILSTGADSGTQTIIVDEADTFTGDANIEKYVLSNDGGSSFTQVAGNISVTSGSGNDTIITSGTDSARGALTVNLGPKAGGGIDTVRILNTTFDGSKTVGDLTQVATFSSNFEAGSAPTTRGVTIDGFTSGTGGDRIEVQYGADLTNQTYVSSTNINEAVTPVTPGFDGTSSGQIRKGVELTTTNLGGVSSGDVIELSSATYQLGGVGSWTIQGVATQLSNNGNGNGLVALNDGYYTVAIYSDNSVNADAFLFNIRVDGGDGLDFSWQANTGGDFDMIEYVGVLRDVGADSLQAVNFL
jgi:hypothetical protein